MWRVSVTRLTLRAEFGHYSHASDRQGRECRLRGVDGGYRLARSAEEITVGDVVREVGGALATVRGRPTTTATYHGAATGLGDVWIAVEAAIEGMVDHKTLAELRLQSGRTDLSTSSTT
jgi:DNA-binding IscR family transcriptional regulator